MSNPYRTRNRIHYGNEFLYTAFDATGYHFNDETPGDPDCELRNIPWTDCSGNLVRQLHRVQAINYGFKTNLEDVNQFGESARVDTVAIKSPEVTLDFEYLLADGYNEQVLGFLINADDQALYKHMVPDGRVGSNFFINFAPEGRDVINANLMYQPERRNTIGIGNAFLSQYAITAELGSMPRARASFEAFNIRSYTGVCNLPVPSFDPVNDCMHPDIKFSLPDTYETFVYEQLSGLEDIYYQHGAGGLRPGDVKISLDGAGLLSEQLTGLHDYSAGAAHIQGFTINLPLGNTRIHRLGRNVEFARSINFPATIDVQVRALVGNLREGGLWDTMCSTKKHNFALILEDCLALRECSGAIDADSINMAFYLKGAVLNTESFASSISDNKIVDLSFSVPVGGVDQKDRGLFIYGKSFFPDRPKLLAWGRPL